MTSTIFRSGGRKTLLASAFVAFGLVGCASPTVQSAGGQTDVNVTKAALPSALPRYSEIDKALTCIRATGRLNRTTFSVGAFADSTGKINSVADGGTGNFLPQGGSSAFVTDALRRAGAQVVSTYFGPPSQSVHVDYAINGIFNSLDFGRTASVDMRAGGVGPVIATGWAQLSLTIQLDKAETRLNRQISIIQRPVRFQQYGFGIGRVIDSTLVTGAAGAQNQERLQMEALNGPIALGVADVIMREFPEVRKACLGTVEDLLSLRAIEPL